ncbi:MULTISPECIES: hypothetical protein [Actinotignum]|uniref:hypothetical protein n=1 Tax=Actinotignum TaxID=1653174 RepID=UPI002551A5F7|nr:hypothetical protein [Actinotignum schaalii]MDE1537095.1 hypothetical protein [Actinotignum schaalii]MDK7272300.1 hypothetical protein [Actinotignum schaalii]
MKYKRITAALALLGCSVALLPAANARTAYFVKDNGVVSASIWTTNNEQTVNVEDEAPDDRWVLGNYTRMGHGDNVRQVVNRSGYGAVVTRNAGGTVSSVQACQSGAGLAPMQCGQWK